jgi:hypothetical protein
LRKDAHFFRRKLAKIAENCDHNIDRKPPTRKIENIAEARLFSALNLLGRKNVTNVGQSQGDQGSML